MTNEDRLASEVEILHSRVLGLLADEAEDRGESNLSQGYLWLRDNNKWPGIAFSGYFCWSDSTNLKYEGYEKCSWLIPFPVAGTLEKDYTKNMIVDGPEFGSAFSALKAAALGVSEYLKEKKK